MANVAVVLSRWGYRVLCIDWDLEAPGLHLYFDQRLNRWPCPGLVDLIHAYKEGQLSTSGWREFLTTVDTGNEQTLDLIPAGLLSEQYVSRTQNLEWDTLYRQNEFGEFLERLRNDWMKNYDLILIDSRTGITDSGGICTIHLPDYLVLFSTANRQSLDGALDVGLRAREQRSKLPYDRSKLLMLPVLTRFDKRVEYSLAQEWMEKFQHQFEVFHNEWKHKDVSSASLTHLTKIPYIAHWSYGERIPVLEERPMDASNISTSDPESISYAFETIAAIIAQGCANTDLLVSNRDSYVASARRQATLSKEDGKSHFLYDAFISYSLPDQRFAEGLAERLQERGIRTWMGSSSEQTGQVWMEQIGKAISSSKQFIFIAGQEISRSQHFESKYFLDATYDQSSALAMESPARTETRSIVPILRQGANPKVLPGFMQSFQFLEEMDQAVEQVADRVLNALSQQDLPRTA